MEITPAPELFFNLSAVADHFNLSTEELKDCLTYLNFHIHDPEGTQCVEFEAAFVVVIRFFTNDLSRVWIVHDLWCSQPSVQNRWKEKDLFDAARLLACGDKRDDDKLAASETVQRLLSKNKMMVRFRYLTLTIFPQQPHPNWEMDFAGCSSTLCPSSF